MAKTVMKCEVCGQEISMAFQCTYCGGQFCAAHRLPENHSCPKLDVARVQRQEAVNVVTGPSTYEYKVTFGLPRRAKGRVYFSPKELEHLGIAVLLIVAVGLLTGLYNGTAFQAGLTISVVAFTVILTVSFFIHEIAHKITAQRRGLWSEFRLTVWGSVVTLICAFLPIKLISPGAVMIAGAAEKRDIGRISIAGPITNLALSIAFFGAGFAPSPYSPFFFFGGFFNGYLAAFNLLPFGVLDGLKIFTWNKIVWGLAFAAAAALTVIGYIVSSYL